MAFVWYALIPTIGAFIVRENWKRFRRRFDNLRSSPLLDYASSHSLDTGPAEFHFAGNFESVTEDKVLWIRSGKLTMPVELDGAYAFMLPNTSEEGIPAAFDPGEEAPERIQWDRIAALTGEAKVFVGGTVAVKNKRRVFVSTPEKSLLVLFYEGGDRFLAIRAIRAGRAKNEYINRFTPYSLILGAFAQIIIALAFFSRPAFREVTVSALTALFIPLLPWVPPGILFTIVYRRLWWRVCILRAYRDLAALLLHYHSPGGESYIAREYLTLPGTFYRKNLPFIIPAGEKRLKDHWHVYGALPVDESGVHEDFPAEPKDKFAVYGALPGDPSLLTRQYNKKANLLEFIAILLLLAGVGINLVFIRTVLSFLGI
ncbi:hypothetical protein [Leadbettera azotonutricia]|uniref:Uncharacterized protein n=1 Tax=Leadbettera azotonutricia (strain ATCC BAA-888 / DSM 13862 / ZAS-9) TaxID=545695 RepID=F5YA05_LEAAZ|nr:hypothetical protein [Leadbettera azotonutricia]AEF82764.1 hypothetical protein TREAZ_2058 [Leadbettera azotonutricia ZAS-9]